MGLAGFHMLVCKADRRWKNRSSLESSGGSWTVVTVALQSWRLFGEMCFASHMKRSLYCDVIDP